MNNQTNKPPIIFKTVRLIRKYAPALSANWEDMTDEYGHTTFGLPLTLGHKGQATSIIKPTGFSAIIHKGDYFSDSIGYNNKVEVEIFGGTLYNTTLTSVVIMTVAIPQNSGGTDFTNTLVADTITYSNPNYDPLLGNVLPFDYYVFRSRVSDRVFQPSQVSYSLEVFIKGEQI